MATKGDVSTLDTLSFGGKPMIPMVSDFTRSRRSGVINSELSGGMTRQRKQFYNNPYVANASFFLANKQEQDFIKIFFARNEGKSFICHLSADRPIVEPYVVRVLEEWQDSYVSAKDGVMTLSLEIDSVRCANLDDLLFFWYQCQGGNVDDSIRIVNQAIKDLP